MKFTKPPKRFDEQRTLALSRGLAADGAKLEALLSTTNYYRLSAYWYTFRDYDYATGVRGEQLAPGCSLDLVMERYAFDRKLRLLVLDAVERIEIALRTQLAYHHAHDHGAFGYIDNPDSLPKLKGHQNARRRADLMQRIEDETRRSEDVFVRSFFKKYGDQHQYLPLWMACEIMTFRTLLTLFQNCTKKVKNAVAAPFGVHESVFGSWLITLNTVRNVCAHHSRLWNREIGAQPAIPTGTAHRDWNTPVLIKHDRMFAPLTVINQCMERVAPDDQWAGRFRALLDAHPRVPARYMGFPPNWLDSPLWTGARSPTPPAPPPTLPTEHPFPK